MKIAQDYSLKVYFFLINASRKCFEQIRKTKAFFLTAFYSVLDLIISGAMLGVLFGVIRLIEDKSINILLLFISGVVLYVLIEGIESIVKNNKKFVEDNHEI